MARWFWILILYNFGGFLLEKIFAAATKARHRVRSCRLLLPLCPVYGLGMAAVLLLPAGIRENAVLLVLCGGLTATGVEYLLHLFYEKALGVAFWDYSRCRLNLKGRVCLPFAAVWGVLAAIAVRYAQPPLEELILRIPPGLTFAAMLLCTADTVISLHLLRRSGNIDLMSVPRLVGELTQQGETI